MIRAPLATNTSRTADFLQENGESTRLLSFWAAWKWWLPPAVFSLVLSAYFIDPFIGDWDGFDYTILSLAGYPSSMALGRNLFIFSNHFLYQVAHALFRIPPESAYLIFKYTVLAQAPLAVIACWILARYVTTSIYAATLAALFVVFSPVFILYAGQVMTDVPSVLLVTAALILHLKGITQHRGSLIVVGAALLGLGMNLRETAGFYALWLAFAPFLLGWKLQRREVGLVALSLGVFVVLGFAWFGYWFVTDSHYRFVW
ncbi:MAG TPA: glycosyltransferase family 39 protein, partial [Candidatus Binatia bacterium]|nr:glycosyltransferase family 39 protein [Candidatus Binatia bacterium]